MALPLLVSHSAQAESKILFRCLDFHQGARLTIYLTPFGEVRYDMIFCGDGTRDPHCLVYGDYNKNEGIDMNRPGNMPNDFVQESVRLTPIFSGFHFHDLERRVGFFFDQDDCRETAP